MIIEDATQEKITFKELGLGERIQKALAENGFEVPFPIQAAAIPLVLEGKDVVGQAHTGTGKTAAFSLPLLTKIKAASRSVQALIIVPTRELAVQVTNEINRFSKYVQITAVSVYGGQSFGLQIDNLRRGAQGKAVSLVSADRFSDFERILRQTKLPIHRLNEVMGIAVPAMQNQRRRPAFGNKNRGRRNFQRYRR